MKRYLIFISVVLAVLLLSAGCSLINPAKESKTGQGEKLKILFAYGVERRNVLNTFEGTYTKDMIMDPPLTINMTLSGEELDAIYAKMLDIDFFNYPGEFRVPPRDGVSEIITPYSSYYFKVQYDSEVKELSWEDNNTIENEDAQKLRELISLIREIAETREEYIKLPPPRGGYL